LVVKKEKGTLVFDKRPDSRIDFWSVNENWNELPNTDKDNVNHPDNLSVEATFISHNFSQQVLSKTAKLEFKEPNPFLDQVQKGNLPASVAFRYRKWKLSEAIQLVALTELNGYTVRKEEKVLMSIKALNEFDSKLSGGVDWRQKLDTQPGAVLATETKNNMTKLSRWAAQAVLAGAQEFKLGFVTRMNTRDSYHHIVLLTQRYAPKSFATTIGVSLANMFATLKALIDICLKQEDGKYLLLKDAAKSVINLYRVPDNAFTNETGEKILADLAPKASLSATTGSTSSSSAH